MIAAMNFDYVVLPILIVVIGVAIAWFAIRRILSLPAKNYSKTRRWLEGVPLSLLALFAIAVAAMSGGNALLLAIARSHVPGQFYQVNGHRMRIDCTGSGEPTIVLDAGLGNDGFIWGGVQPELAKTTRVCSYDRAGFGFSDAVPGPRDADHIADELHGLLQAAGINGPIVLMGHSIAGIYIRDYATRYPAQIAGLVFVDGSTPLQDTNPAFAKVMKFPSSFQVALFRLMDALGLPRLEGACSRKLPGFSADAMRLQNEDSCHAELSSSLAELRNIHRSGEETAQTGPYGDLPILIFSQDTTSPADAGEPADIRTAWDGMQENLKKLSARSRRIVAKGSGHYVQINRRDLILKELPPFIAEIRNPQQSAPGDPAGYGSTTTQ
jgi:pimeloyl-ACP methyl ester carboxylesterase